MGLVDISIDHLDTGPTARPDHSYVFLLSWCVQATCSEVIRDQNRDEAKPNMQKMFERVNTAMENPEWGSVMHYDDVTRWLLSKWGFTVA